MFSAWMFIVHVWTYYRVKFQQIHLLHAHTNASFSDTLLWIQSTVGFLQLKLIMYICHSLPSIETQTPVANYTHIQVHIKMCTRLHTDAPRECTSKRENKRGLINTNQISSIKWPTPVNLEAMRQQPKRRRCWVNLQETITLSGTWCFV